MTHETSGMRLLKIREGRANIFLLAQERNRGVILCKGFRDRVGTIRAKARVDYLKVEDISGRLANQCRGHVSLPPA